MRYTKTLKNHPDYRNCLARSFLFNAAKKATEIQAEFPEEFAHLNFHILELTTMSAFIRWSGQGSLSISVKNYDSHSKVNPIAHINADYRQPAAENDGIYLYALFGIDLKNHADDALVLFEELFRNMHKR